MIAITRFQSPIGKLTIMAVKEGVVKISFANNSLEELEKWCLDHLGMGIVNGNSTTSWGREQILNYLSGKLKSLNFPVLHLNSPFRKRVLETERKVPYGETRSYAEVAAIVGNPKAFRAVGTANAENPLPLYFPCHRIINSSGQLGGYGGGMKMKKYLLDLESSF